MWKRTSTYVGTMMSGWAGLGWAVNRFKRLRVSLALGASKYRDQSHRYRKRAGDKSEGIRYWYILSAYVRHGFHHGIGKGTKAGG